ncbi:HSP20-like chaperone [Pseudocohnilembus persalinus]|uniref:HSP20-like chaperone n=1 Tax=Pseudocohnilembus persalinus TaxID=266149 RepID=A0A0V0QUL1_PSEPJ|nr:HSP20-like chaperone [Pseudocohnilembus persalinus]|eukprot:KRX06057.1 HSP20-like chaperone [Pseudocohnilembus persalinus]
MATLSAPFKWTQRKEHIYLTVELRDIKDEKIDIQPNTLKFSGKSDGKQYDGEVEFYDEIDVEKSSYTILGLHARFLLAKKNQDADFWPRLTKDKTKQQNITVDWDRYVDEDEDTEENKMDWDQSQMQGMEGLMGGMGGMGGMQGMQQMQQMQQMQAAMQGMQGMGGMGGMPGMPGQGEEDDSDDEDPNQDLDKEEEVVNEEAKKE